MATITDWNKALVDLKAGVRLTHGLQPGTRALGSNPGLYPFTSLDYAREVCELFAAGLAPTLLAMDREFASGVVAFKVIAARVRGVAWPLNELIDFADAYVESRRTVLGGDPTGAAAAARVEVGSLYRIAEAAANALNAYKVASYALVNGPSGRFYLGAVDNVRFWDSWAKVALEYAAAGARISYPSFWDAVNNEAGELARDVGEAANAAGKLAGDVAKATARLAGNVAAEAAAGFGIIPLVGIGAGIYLGGKIL